MPTEIQDYSDNISAELEKILSESAQKVVDLIDTKLKGFQQRLDTFADETAIMRDDECGDFISELILDHVVFMHDEAVEQLAFLNPKILEAIKSQNDENLFESSSFWAEGDNLMMCQIVLNAARRHFDVEYKSKSVTAGGPCWALFQASERYKEKME